MVTKTLTLTEFLLARFAEDEADPPTCSWREAGAYTYSKVLAECEAKRRIVELHQPEFGFTSCATCAMDDDIGPVYPCLTIRILAEPYADHPDYREEWRAPAREVRPA